MGDHKRGIILLLVLISLAVAIPEIEIAEADSRTLVVPDDYPTIAAAIGNATDGDTIFVKKGTYDGPINQTLVIAKTISLIGEDQETTILNLYPEYIIRPDVLNFPRPDYDYSLKILADDVELSGFTINSIMLHKVELSSITDRSAGKLITNGNNTQIINNILNLNVWLKGSYENFAHNNLKNDIIGNGPHGIIAKNNIMGLVLVAQGTPHYTIHDNVIIKGSGIIVAGVTTRIFNNTVNNCSLGVRMTGGSHDNFVYENILTNNDIGLSAETFRENNVFYSNYVANNEIGITSGREGYIRGPNTVYNNSFVDNTQQVEILDDFEGDQWDNGSIGNYWRDYTGVDADGDGIGDTPYVIDENNQDNYPLMQPVTIPLLQPLEICILSPQNQTYATNSVNLTFTTNKETLWMGYSLDEEDNVTITGNILNLTGLANGVHTLTVYATDTTGNNGTSETVTFTVNKPDPTPALTATATAIAAAAIVGAVVIVYTKTKKKQDTLDA